MKFFLKRLIGIPAALPSLLLIVVVSVIIYGNTFDNAFIFDDSLHLREGTVIRNFFRNFEWGFLLVSRNIVNMTFAMNHLAGGLHVFGYHVVNLVIHILNGIVVFFLSSLMLKRLTGFSPGPAGHEDDRRNRLVALFASLIFVAHPVQTQAVTYVIQRYTSMAALFYLAAVLFYLKARSLGRCERGTPEREKGIKRKETAGKTVDRAWSVPVFFGLFVLCALLAFLSKQNAASLPLAILAVEYFFVDRSSEGWKRKIPWIALAFFLWGGFILYVSGFFGYLPAGGGLQDAGPGGIFEGFSQMARETEDIGRWTYLITQFNVLVVYIRLFLLPVGQSLDYLYPFSRGFFHGTTPYAFILLLSIAGAAVWFRKKLPLLSFGVIWFFITLSVESSLIPIRDALFEHRLYLPLFGLSLALAGGVFRLFRRKEAWAVGLLAVLVVTLSAATHLRNRVWQDGVTIWTDVIEKNPGNFRAYNNLALAFKESGNYDEAEKALKRALRIRPLYEAALINLGSLYQVRQQPEKAAGAYREALAQNPGSVEAQVGLGEVLKKAGELEEAVESFREILVKAPGDVRARIHLAELLAAGGKFGEAKKLLQEAHGSDPENPQILIGMGNLMRFAGERKEALQYYDRAVRIDRDAREAYLNMAGLMFQENRYGEAEQFLREALRINPRDEKARNDLGGLLLAGGRLSDAGREFRKVLETDPQNGAALFNLARVHEVEGRAEEAAEYYEKALAVNPANWEAAMHLGGIHAARGGFDSARHWYDKSLSVNPHNARLHNRMAIVLMRLGNFDDARAHYEKAARVDSALKPVVLYNLACLESLRNRPAEALSLLEGAFLAGYGDCGKAKTDPDLEIARKHPQFAGLMKTYCRDGS